MRSSDRIRPSHHRSRRWRQLLGCHAATGAVGAVSLRIFSAAGAVDGHGDTDLSRIIPKALDVAAGRAPHFEV
ncbi:MAG: hypothetical protein ACRDYX_22210 [Egibacteraceae bacterium]